MYFQRKSTISQSEQETTSNSPVSSPVKKIAPKVEPPSFGKIPVVKEPEPDFYAIPLERLKKEKTPVREDLPAYVPRIEPPREPSPLPKKEKKIPPVEHKNPTPMGVFPRNRIPSYSKKLTSDDEDSRANSAMSNVTDSEAEKEVVKPSESSAAPSDFEKVTDAEEQKTAENGEAPKKKKKIIKKKIVIKKVVKKKKKVPEEPAVKPEASESTLNNNYTESESEADSRPASKLQNNLESESEKEAEDSQSEKKIPPPVLPKTSRVSSYSGYTPSSSGYNNSRYGGYSSRYSRY